MRITSHGNPKGPRESKVCNFDSVVAPGFTVGVVPSPYESGEPAVINLSKRPMIVFYL